MVLAMGILIKETVCLNKIKGVVGAITGKTTTQPLSHYKRLIRIFDMYSFSSLWLELLQFAFSLLRLKSDYLLLDGTSWQKGERKVHYLTLCLVYQGVAIPIYWAAAARKICKSKGTSNLKERKRVIRKAMKHYNLKDKTLLADREYIGEDRPATRWFCFLKESGIDFVIRLRKKNYKESVNAAKGKSYTALEKKALRSRKLGKAVGKRITLQGEYYTFVVLKNPKADADEPLIYLLSTLEEAPACIAARYPIRWKIETCFKHLKSTGSPGDGFKLEEINLASKSRCKLMMAVVIFAYTLSVHEGLKEYKKVPMKQYADGLRTKPYSVFRRGLDKLTACCASLVSFCEYLVENLITNLPHYKSKYAIIV